MKHQIILFIGIVFTSLLPQEVLGQTPQFRERMDRVKYRTGNQSRAILQRDRRELENFNQTLFTYQEALSNRNRRRTQALMQDLVADMRREVRQSERKLINRSERYVSSNRPSRRPDGVSPSRRSTNGYRSFDSRRRRNILETQEDILFDFLHIQDVRTRNRSRARNLERKKVELLSEFLTTMDSEFRLSRKELDMNRHSRSNRRSQTRY